MSDTIDFSAKPDGARYTLAQVNALFAAIALVLNEKLDVDARDALGSDLNVGDAPVLNLAEAVADREAITMGQLAAIAAEFA